MAEGRTAMVSLGTSRSKDLDWLMQRAASPCVSLFMPTHRSGAKIREDPIRFRNLLSEAERQLVTYGMRRPVARDCIALARHIGEDGAFWRHQDFGLAMFIKTDADPRQATVRHWNLPFTIPERVSISETFVLRPLLPLMSRPNRWFYVLILGQKHIELLLGSREQLRSIDLPEAPHSLDDLARFIDAEKSLQFHTGTGESGQGGLRPAIFHGHGTDDTRQNKRLFELFRMLDDALRPRLRNETAPLIPVGVEWVISVFRSATTYGHVTDQQLHGNFDYKMQELHAPAWDIASQVFQQDQEAVLAEYQQQQGSHRATVDLHQVMAMAGIGQVESLLVDLQQRQWGRQIDPVARRFDLHDSEQPGDQELIERAVLEVLQTSGEVHVLPSERMPEQAPLAAILRRGAPVDQLTM